ncbi:multidrug transporter CflA [Burkholderia pseudomultivorans]|uniref:multidrug effflux MFS transporter n=1 Tax=Burkholderia pseudomultivorans TaxID=1207504 RepID=UPI00075D6EDA|nr:multidrug effflux MFS transporter [Burkholderia pseudomultivorans]KWI47397.1 multidrug transporter CflA [Burkholderia pseudomultivorans]
MNDSAHSRKPRAPSLFILVCITLSGTFPLHVFVPALPAAAQDLHANAARIGTTITVYVMGLSIGQLVYGPLSDRYGRRPVLLLGLTLFVCATLGATVSPSLAALEFARIAQALGGCAGLVLGRAIARDSSGSTALIRRLATLSISMAIATAVAPVIGGQLVAHFGWRSIFSVMTVVSMGVLAAVAWRVPETHVPARDLGAGTYVRKYLQLLKTRAFVMSSIGGACSTTGIYAFLAASPFILETQLGMSANAFGFAYLLLVASLACGQSAAKRIAHSVPPRTALVAASLIMGGGSVSLAVSHAIHMWTAVTVMVPMLVIFFATGLSSPYAISSALDVDKSVAGAASGLYGSLQMGYGALCTGAINLHTVNPATSTIVVLLVSSGVAWLSFSSGPRRVVPVV